MTRFITKINKAINLTISRTKFQANIDTSIGNHKGRQHCVLSLAPTRADNNTLFGTHKSRLQWQPQGQTTILTLTTTRADNITRYLDWQPQGQTTIRTFFGTHKGRLQCLQWHPKGQTTMLTMEPTKADNNTYIGTHKGRQHDGHSQQKHDDPLKNES